MANTEWNSQNISATINLFFFFF